MPLRKTVAQEVQEYSDYKKQHEFFVVAPTMGTFQKPKSYQERLESWIKMCQKVHLPLKDCYVEGGDERTKTAVLMFQNGLKITDNGLKVAFSATDEKSKVDKTSAMTVIRCSANHLYRHGWDVGIDFSTVRSGAVEMLIAFEEAYKEARQIVNAERIEQMKKSR